MSARPNAAPEPVANRQSDDEMLEHLQRTAFDPMPLLQLLQATVSQLG